MLNRKENNDIHQNRTNDRPHNIQMSETIKNSSRSNSKELWIKTNTVSKALSCSEPTTYN